MTFNKTHLVVFIVGAVLGLISGFFTGKAIYDQPMDESVTRDTMRITDTIPHYYPQAIDGTVVRYVTKFFPITRKDTIDHFVEVSKMVYDTVAVEVPIESRHYHGKEYDAWVSGYEPSLDSIKVYREKEYITETITRMKPPNKFELDIVGGIDYNTASQKYTPYIGGEFMYKPNRLQLGLQGGVVKMDKVEPIVGVKAKYRLF